MRAPPVWRHGVNSERDAAPCRKVHEKATEIATFAGMWVFTIGIPPIGTPQPAYGHVYRVGREG